MNIKINYIFFFIIPHEQYIYYINCFYKNRFNAIILIYIYIYIIKDSSYIYIFIVSNSFSSIYKRKIIKYY